MKIVKTQPIRTTSFSLIGSLHLTLADLHQQPAWVLNKVVNVFHVLFWNLNGLMSFLHIAYVVDSCSRNINVTEP
jgi:hypothetical protein